MSYSTTTVVAYGFDADGYDIEALEDESSFADLARQLDIAHLVELEQYGDARDRMYPIVVVTRTKRTGDVYGVTNLTHVCQPTPAEVEALDLVCKNLNIEPNIGLKLYGYVY